MTNVLIAYFTLAIVLDHAHLVCPIWLGWSNRAFREHMLTRPEKFVLLPALCVLVSLGIGVSSAKTHDLLFRLLALTYLWWNAWHFGSQHFGLASLLGLRVGPRWLRQGIIIGPTMILMLSPVHPLAVIILGEIVSFAHWTTDLGLSTWAGRWRISLLMALLVGLAGFLWKAVIIDPRFCGALPACAGKTAIPALLGLRYGFGFWHFLMSRWVWKLSDPQVRVTIGQDLLCRPAGVQQRSVASA